jgi:hypothetical protein
VPRLNWCAQCIMGCCVCFAYIHVCHQTQLCDMIIASAILKQCLVCRIVIQCVQGWDWGFSKAWGPRESC